MPHHHHHERGAAATEHGVLVAFIGLVILAGVGLFGGSVDAWYQRIVDALATVGIF